MAKFIITTILRTSPLDKTIVRNNVDDAILAFKDAVVSNIIDRQGVDTELGRNAIDRAANLSLEIAAGKIKNARVTYRDCTVSLDEVS